MMKMSLGMAVIFMALGGLSVKTVEEVVGPRIQYGWNKIDDQRHEYCTDRSRKWYRKVTLQVQRTYQRCMDHEI